MVSRGAVSLTRLVEGWGVGGGVAPDTGVNSLSIKFVHHASFLI